jgi:hypothetical protein
VPVICVINPGSGPGTVWDGNYAATITLLQAAGATVIGYVSTSYAARDPAAVRADVLMWHTLYAATPVNGIFFDELPYDPGVGNASVTLYEGYYNYVKSVGYSLIVANPGTNEQAIWYQNKVADIIVTWETSSWPAVADMQGLFVGGHSNFDWRVNAMLVYNQPSLDIDKLTSMLPYVKWAFITDDNLPNPWDTIGSYAETLFAAISTSNASAYEATSGGISIVSGNPAGTASGNVTIATGNASGSGHTVGSITLQPGTASSSATAGNIILSNIPTSDPHVVGALYSSAGTMKISAG